MSRIRLKLRESLQEIMERLREAMKLPTWDTTCITTLRRTKSNAISISSTTKDYGDKFYRARGQIHRSNITARSFGYQDETKHVYKCVLVCFPISSLPYLSISGCCTISMPTTRGESEKAKAATSSSSHAVRQVVTKSSIQHWGCHFVHDVTRKCPSFVCLIAFSHYQTSMICFSFIFTVTCS